MYAVQSYKLQFVTISSSNELWCTQFKIIIHRFEIVIIILMRLHSALDACIPLIYYIVFCSIVMWFRWNVGPCVCVWLGQHITCLSVLHAHAAAYVSINSDLFFKRNFIRFFVVFRFWIAMDSIAWFSVVSSNCVSDYKNMMTFKNFSSCH